MEILTLLLTRLGAFVDDPNLTSDAGCCPYVCSRRIGGCRTAWGVPQVIRLSRGVRASCQYLGHVLVRPDAVVRRAGTAGWYR